MERRHRPHLLWIRTTLAAGTAPRQNGYRGVERFDLTRLGAWAGIVAGLLVIMITAMALTAFNPVRVRPQLVASETSRVQPFAPNEAPPNGPGRRL